MLSSRGCRLADAGKSGSLASMPRTDEETMQLWREQCRCQLRRPLSDRLKYGFVAVANRERINRSFDSLSAYRAWCEANLPSYLGYGRADSLA